MSIDEHIIANPILRKVDELLSTPYLKQVLEIQTAKGLAKYPNLVNVDDYSVTGWIDHNIQELIDSTVYTVAAIKRIEKDYGIKGFGVRGDHYRIINVLQLDIRENVKKLERLEVLRNHYAEESK
jgi:hypothetical protein